MNLQICRQCSLEKPLLDFHKSKTAKNGHKKQCKVCRKIEASKHHKTYYSKNRELIIQRKTKYGLDQREKVYSRTIQRTYGINIQQYKEMFIKQAGVCAICLNPETYSPKGKLRQYLCIDHNHSTGKVRALLCNSCNKGISDFKENPLYLTAAAIYVRQHNVT